MRSAPTFVRMSQQPREDRQRRSVETHAQRYESTASPAAAYVRPNTRARYPIRANASSTAKPSSSSVALAGMVMSAPGIPVK